VLAPPGCLCSVDSVTRSPFSCLYFPLLAHLYFILSTIQSHGQLNIVPDAVFYHKVDIITLNFKSIGKQNYISDLFVTSKHIVEVMKLVVT
jgi:hypothetical protein